MHLTSKSFSVDIFNKTFPAILAFISLCYSFVESELLKTIAAALMDFAELNCYNALQLLLEVH